MTYRRLISSICAGLCLMFLFAGLASAGSVESVKKHWSKKQIVKDKFGGEVTFNLTYYSAEYIEAILADEAERNLWTADELENYKYQLLKTLKLGEYIPVKVAIDNRGPSMHMAPFDRMITLRIGTHKYSPADYDKRFNFKLKGKREGLVFFPRYDVKTDKPILERAKTIRLIVDRAVSPVTMEKDDVVFLWDVDKDNPEKLLEGRASARLEMDRLIKRLARLNDQKKDLEKQLAEVQAELDKIQRRVDEIQAQ